MRIIWAIIGILGSAEYSSMFFFHLPSFSAHLMPIFAFRRNNSCIILVPYLLPNVLLNYQEGLQKKWQRRLYMQLLFPSEIWWTFKFHWTMRLVCFFCCISSGHLASLKQIHVFCIKDQFSNISFPCRETQRVCFCGIRTCIGEIRILTNLCSLKKKTRVNMRISVSLPLIDGFCFLLGCCRSHR